MYNADKPTSAYTAVFKGGIPPTSVSTRFMFARPTKPQFKPPIITRISAIQSKALFFKLLHPGGLTPPDSTLDTALKPFFNPLIDEK